MLARVLEAGLTPAEFWQSTPRETFAAVRGYQWRRGWLAWHTALLGRVDHKHFPRLDQMTGEEPAGPKRQTPEEMIAVLERVFGPSPAQPEGN